MMKGFVSAALLLLLVASGCGEKKVEPAKLDEAVKLIEKKEYEKAVALLDELGKSSPSDEALKKVRVDCYLKYGNYFMYESVAPPKEKYPSALHQYRLAAAIDPTNTEAKQNIQLIEGIYNQMGRPVPN